MASVPVVAHEELRTSQERLLADATPVVVEPSAETQAQTTIIDVHVHERTKCKQDQDLAHCGAEMMGLREDVATLQRQLKDAYEQRDAAVAKAKAAQHSNMCARMEERVVADHTRKLMQVVQKDLEEAIVDVTKWKQTYLQNQVRRKLETVQEGLRMLMYGETGVSMRLRPPEPMSEKTVAGSWTST